VEGSRFSGPRIEVVFTVPAASVPRGRMGFSWRCGELLSSCRPSGFPDGCLVHLRNFFIAHPEHIRFVGFGLGLRCGPVFEINLVAHPSRVQQNRT
jgi:hypothetical protein